MPHDSQRQAGAQIVGMLGAELLRQDPSIVDLSDGDLTQVQIFEPIDLWEMAAVVQQLCRDTATG
jgi:hypothetical protein